MILFEIFSYVTISQESNYNIYLYYATMTIPYIIVFTIGYNIHIYSKNDILLNSFLLFSVYITYAIYYIVTLGEYQNTSVAKYPPMLYYTSYAMAVILILYVYRGIIQNVLKVMNLENAVCYLGSHTIWIYFWHIPFVNIGFLISDNSLFRYVFVYAMAIILTMTQEKIITQLINTSHNSSWRRNLKLIFIG